MLRLALAMALFAVAGCGRSATPPECAGGCRDVCKSPVRVGPQWSAAKKCARDYDDGYNVGFCAGMDGEHVFGVNSDGFVAGYYDGFADGEADKRAGRASRC